MTIGAGPGEEIVELQMALVMRIFDEMRKSIEKSTSFWQIETHNTVIDDPRGKSCSPTGGDLPHQRPVDEPCLSSASFEINICCVLLETR